MIGYDSIEPRSPLVPCAPSFEDPRREFVRRVKRAVCPGLYRGFELFVLQRRGGAAAGPPVDDHVRVLNPIAADQDLLRTSLIPGIHRNIVENAKHFDRFRIFETGHEIRRGKANWTSARI